MPASMTVENFSLVARLIQDWMSIHDIVRLADEVDREHHIWNRAFFRGASYKLKVREVRKLCRSKNLRDEHGKRIELVNLKIFDDDGNLKGNAYKQLTLFDKADFQQVIRDRLDREAFWHNDAARLIRLALAKYGHRETQQMLPFLDLDNYAGEATN